MSSSSEENEPPVKQPRKQWLQDGQVPRSTLIRWRKEATENAESSDSSSTDSSNNSSSNSSSSSSTSNSDDSSPESEVSNVNSEDEDNDLSDHENIFEIPWQNIGGDGDGDDGESNDEDEDIRNAGNFEFMPEALFRQSQHTAGQAVLRLLQLYSKHAMTKSCLKDLIHLIHSLLPLGNTFPSTYYYLHNNIAPFIPPKSCVEHVACANCGFYLGEFSTTPAAPCPVPGCGKLIRVKFDEFSLPVLIKYLFERRGLADVIDAHGDGAGADISKSEEYIRVKEQYSSKYDLVLLWNADGVKVRKSGPASLWELSITICEVPPELRRKFTIVIGLWYAEKKPNLKTFLTPFIRSLIQLERNGVRWTHPTTGLGHVSKVVAPAATVDAPVRADLQNIMHHGGEFSCHTCEIEGMELILGPRSSKRVYPVPEEPCQLRTKDNMRIQALRAEQQNVIVMGVKGTSLLESIPSCDEGKTIILDYLHLVLLGIVRQFYCLWFTGSGTDWYIGRTKRQVTTFLREIKRTYEVCRCPSDASQWKLFKGSTWRTWLLFVSLPALRGILKDKYYQHWMLLVIGMSLLLQEEISQIDLALADTLLSLFVRDTQELYGYSAMSYNLHCLSHLALITRRWGAPWAVSTFKFENLNGILARLVHGNIRITTELSNTLNIVTATNTLDFLMNEAENLQMGPRVSLLSHVDGMILSDAERNALVETLTDTEDMRLFRRAKIAGKIFTSVIYSAERATDNKHVCYEIRRQYHYGIVQFYVQKGPDFYALLKKLLVEPGRQFQHTETGLIVEHIIPIQCTDEYAVIPLAYISCKVFRIHGYVCKELNRYEHAL